MWGALLMSSVEQMIPRQWWGPGPLVRFHPFPALSERALAQVSARQGGVPRALPCPAGV